MNTNIHDRHLIERFLRKELSGIELENFEEQLKANPSLKSQLELQQQITIGIQMANKEHLKGIILRSLT